MYNMCLYIVMCAWVDRSRLRDENKDKKVAEKRSSPTTEFTEDVVEHNTDATSTLHQDDTM